MRAVLISVSVGFLVLSLGCDRWVWHNDRPAVNRVPAGTPKPEQLVSFLNLNAQRIRSLESFSLDIDAKQDNQPVGLMGTLACQKAAVPGAPPNFRMQARALGNTEVDIGSNSEEFWYWIRRAPQPYVFHCSYADFRAGKARMPFPFQPEWIVEALGVAELNPNVQYQVREGRNNYELVERSLSPQGQPVQKVTVFSRAPAQNKMPQILAHVLQDGNGKEICSAHVVDVQTDQVTGAVLPRMVKMRWPQEKMELTLRLNQLRVNSPIDEARAADLFTRRRLSSMPGYDLARGPDSPPNQIRPAGGIYR
jgi:hypothetical protein